MKIKWKLFAVLAVLLVTLAACNMNGKNNTGKNDTNTEPTRYNNNDHYRTDRNNTKGMDRYQNEANDRYGDHNRINDENYTRDDRKGNDDKRYRVSKEAADRITKRIPDVKRAYVLTTKNNAYVAAEIATDRNNNGAANNGTETNNNNNRMGTETDSGHELTDDVKKEISDIVKGVDRDIDNVHVSTNPDFYNLTNNYATDAKNGKPVRGMFDQLGNMIERIFPQNR